MANSSTSTLGSGPILPPAKTHKYHPAVYISAWILCSGSLIILNKHIFNSFNYPIFLTSYHLAFCSILAAILKNVKPSLFTNWDNVKERMDRGIWVRRVLPIAICYCFSLVCNNEAYLYLNVPLIQMMKGATPVAVLFIGYITFTARPNMKTILTVLLIVFGISLTIHGELEFSWIGVGFQVLGICFEASRLVMIQRLLSGELKMDPLTSILWFAPLCAVFNFTAFMIIEYPKMTYPLNITFPILLINGLNAFALNVAVVFLIGATSSLVLTLSGIFKDILLIGVSMLIFHTELTLIQVVGYAIALVGLYRYKTMPKEGEKKEKDRTEMLPVKQEEGEGKV